MGAGRAKCLDNAHHLPGLDGEHAAPYDAALRGRGRALALAVGRMRRGAVGRGWVLRAAPRLGLALGGATFVFLLLPVLGLRNHTYHYYLYAPLIGASWCAAALVDAMAASRAAGGRGQASYGARGGGARVAPGFAPGLADRARCRRLSRLERCPPRPQDRAHAVRGREAQGRSDRGSGPHRPARLRRSPGRADSARGRNSSSGLRPRCVTSAGSIPTPT
jgi:hypothetical protein